MSDLTAPVGAPKRTTSKMALLLSFAAGAAFSWILMNATDDEPAPVAAPSTVLIQRR